MENQRSGEDGSKGWRAWQVGSIPLGRRADPERDPGALKPGVRWTAEAETSLAERRKAKIEAQDHEKQLKT